MELSAEERAAIAKLIALAWQTGNVQSPEDGAFLEALRARLAMNGTGEGIALPMALSLIHI